ncbi:MAG: glycosyltransferase [Marinilabiliaceae bacterium]|nr:glycosyltransferase [Marinilabiliaceae bacterium]
MWFVFGRVNRIRILKTNAQHSETQFTPHVSVIICAKNEEENLTNFLPSVLTQDYPNYQVVVVNDSSEDNSELILAQFKSKYSHLYYTNIPIDKKFSHGKKLAISIGVKAATHNYLVFTDADCKPASNKWLETMVQGFKPEGKEIVIGFGGYLKQKGITNLIIRYDTFFTALQYMGFAFSGKPYMGVGRNLAYKKDLFIKNDGLKSHLNILSGDDDLFVKETATKQNVSIVTNPDAHTISVPHKTLNHWRLQKARHLTTAHLYNFSVKSELILEPISREIFWFMIFYMIISNTFALVSIGFLIVNYLIKILIWKKIAKILNQGKLYWSLLLFDFIHPWILLWAFFSKRKGTKIRKWK